MANKEYRKTSRVRSKLDLAPQFCVAQLLNIYNIDAMSKSYEAIVNFYANPTQRPPGYKPGVVNLSSHTKANILFENTSNLKE